MKIKFVLIASAIFFIDFYAHCQSEAIPKSISSLNLSFGLEKELYSSSVSWNRSIGVLSGNKIRLGYGLRIFTFSGKNLNYTSAPASLASDIAKVDTLFLAKASSIAANALIDLQYKVNNKLAIGFNIDAIGIGIGDKINTTFISSENKNSTFSKTPEAKPTSFDVLLVGNNDIGQLKSELYLLYQFSNHLGLRAGIDYTFSEYTTKTKLTQNNDRFRYKASMFFFGINYQL